MNHPHAPFTPTRPSRLRAAALALATCAWAFSTAAAAADLTAIPRSSQSNFASDLRAAAKLASAAQVKAQLGQVRDQLLAADGAERNRFDATAKHIRDKKLPPAIERRHREMLAQYDREFSATLTDLDAAAAATNQTQTAAKLAAVLKRVEGARDSSKIKPRLVGQPKAKALRKPRIRKNDLRLAFASDQVMLADAGSVGLILGAAAVGLPTAEHLAQTEDAQITPRIQDLAQQLHGNPVEIYHWVRNNVDYLPTYGSIQGSELTYLNKRGNAYDTASLLVALLRASSVPARYVYGTVEIPADQVLNWVGGVESVDAALQLLAQSGIPAATAVEGGKVTRIQVEHVWVEAWVDFEPSRGVRNIEGDSWVPMDASFKQYLYTKGLDLARDLRFDGESFIQQLTSAATRDDTNGSATGIDPAVIEQQLQGYRQQVSRFITATHPNATVATVLGGETLIQQNLSGLSPVLPYKIVAATDPTTSLPDSLRWKLKLELFASSADRGSNRVSAGLTRSLPALGNQNLSIGFVPETADDQAALNSYLPQPHADGSPIQPDEFPGEVPGYLIHVRPQVLLGGQALSTGTGVALGTAQPYSAVLFDPASQAWESVADETLDAGEHHGIAVDGAGFSAGPLTAAADSLALLQQKLLARNLTGLERDDIAGAALRYTALNYLALIDASDRLFQRVGQIVGVRLPSLARAFTDVEAELSFGVPTAVRFPGASLRLDRLVSAIAPRSSESAVTGYAPYRRASLERASAYAHGVLENIYRTPAAPVGSSAIRVLAQSAVGGIPVYYLQPSNLETALQRIELPAAEENLLRDGIAAHLRGLAPEHPVPVGVRPESAYVLNDPQTGAGDYRLSGGDSGHLHGRNLLWLALGSPEQSAAGALPILGAARAQQAMSEFLLGDMDGQRLSQFPGQEEVTNSLLLGFVNAGAGEGAGPWIVVATTAESTTGALSGEGTINHAPRFTTSPLTDAVEREIYRYPASAADPEGDPLSYSIASSPTGVKISTTGLVSWDQPVKGTWTVVLRVDDGKAFTEQAYALVVAKGPDPLDATLKISTAALNPGQQLGISLETLGGKGPVTRTLTVGTQNVTIAASAPNPFGYFHTANDAPGKYTITARAIDSEKTVERTLVYTIKGAADEVPPNAAITYPVTDQELHGPVNIQGTATDENFGYYRLMAKLSDAPDTAWTELKRGTEAVTDGVLGRFDPTKLENGIYDIALFVYDTNGRETATQVPVEVIGDLKIGQFSLSFEDLAIETQGIPIRITRTYDTRKKAKKGDFGYGWTAAYQDFGLRQNMKIGIGWAVTNVQFQLCARVIGQRKVSITLPDGSVDRFKVNGTDQCAFGTLPTPTVDFDPLPGTRSTLSIANMPPLEFRNDSIVDRINFEVYNPQEFKLVRAEDGLTYHLKNGVGITKIEDVDGNVLTYDASGIHHSSGIGINVTRDSEGRITAITDLLGKQLKYTYDAEGNLETFTNRLGEQTRITYNREHGLVEYIDAKGVVMARQMYDDEGRLIATIDVDGKRTELEHDLENSIEKITNKRGFTTTYKYDETGNVSEMIDALGHKTTYVHDFMGNELKVTDPLGHVTERAFDPQHGQILWEKDPLGNVTEYTYLPSTRTDKSQRLAKVKDARGNETEYSSYVGAKPSLIREPLGRELHLFGPGEVTRIRVATGNPLSSDFRLWSDTGSFVDNPAAGTTYVDDGLGHRTYRTYDANTNLIATSTTRVLLDGSIRTVKTAQRVDSEGRVIEETDPAGYKTTTTYTKAGKPKAVTDQLGRTTTYDYDGQDRVTRITYADGTYESVTYDESSNEIAKTDTGGRTTGFEYDALDRLIKTIYPDGTSISQEYDEAGRQTKVIDPKGYVTISAYDAAGRLKTLTDALGHTTKYEYDENGNRTKVTDAKQQSMLFEYDALNRLTKTISPDSSFSTVSYRPDGLKESRTDETGRVSRYDYDVKGQLKSVTQVVTRPGEPHPVEAITRYEYDELGNKTAQTDAEGRVTRWAYDDLNRVISRTLPEGQIEHFTYHATGSRASHTDFNGRVTTFSYDALSREILRVRPDRSTVRTAYTANGQVETQTDESGVLLHRSYDARDRLVRVAGPQGSVRYQYDDAGNRVLVSTGSQGTRYEFDEVHREVAAVDGEGRRTVLEYDDNGNLTAKHFPNGTQSQYTYDSANRLTDIRHLGPDNVLLAGFHYTLAANGQRTRIQESDASGPIRTLNYAYDSLQRLTLEAVVHHLDAASNYTISFEYDKTGNRLSQTRTDGNGVTTTTYGYDGNDRLLIESATAPGGGASSSSTTYEYDLNGNAAKKVMSAAAGAVALVSLFSYDFENRLTQVRSGASEGSAQMVSRHAYDPNGNRVRTDSSNGNSTSYLVDPNQPYAQVIEEFSVGPSGSERALYLHGDDLVSQTRGGQQLYYHDDGLGSTRLLTDARGNVVDRYDYEAFGNLIAREGSSRNDFLFTGEQLDQSSGLVYLRARWLDTSIAQFTSADPFIGFDCDPALLHDYAYARQDPVNYIDSSGLVPQTVRAQSIATNALSGLQSAARYSGIKKSFNLLRKACKQSGRVIGKVRHHIIPWFTRGIVGAKKGFRQEELFAMAESVHDKFHVLQDLVLRFYGLTARGQIRKTTNPYPNLRSTGNMDIVLDALLFSAELFDEACKDVSGGYKMTDDVKSMKSQLGL